MADEEKKSKKYSKNEERVSKILKEIASPIKTPLKVIGYFISDDGETRTEIDAG
jgi:hypothetical protein